MSEKYNEYLVEHRSNVLKGFEWFVQYMPEIFEDEQQISDIRYQIEFCHDKSKDLPDEYEAYDKYFYGGNQSYEVKKDFERAWLFHIHRNPHHWQHWVLKNDDPNEGEKCIPMDFNYIIEMICDWWSFSWKKGDLTEIFKWYDEHKNYIKLNHDTYKTVKFIFDKMKTVFNDEAIVVRN